MKCRVRCPLSPKGLNMFIRVFVLLIVGFILSGCASVDNTVWLPESISKASTSAYGTVFGSIGIGENNRLITSRSLHYRAVGQKDSGQFRFNNGGLFNSPVDFSEGAILRKRVFCTSTTG